MATLSVTNTFVNTATADATEVNTNFTDVETVVNSLDNDNIAVAAAIGESKILFSNTGHNHSGGGNGVNIPEANVVFAGAGHDHSGTTEGNTIDLGDTTGVAGAAQIPAAVDAGAHGALFFENGTTANLAAAAYEDVTFTAVFTQIPIVQAVISGGSESVSGYTISSLDSSGFRITNGAGNPVQAFKWTAIGI